MYDERTPPQAGPIMDDVSGDLVTPDYMALLRTVSDWTWRTDDIGLIVELSPSIAKVTRRPAAEYRGFPFSAWGRFIEPPISDLCDYEAVRWRAPFSDLAFVISDEKGGQRLFLITGTPVFSPDDGRYLGYFGTARESEASAAKLGAEPVAEPMAPAPLAVAEPMPQSAGDLQQQLTLLSHDIRDPLNAMLGFVQLIGDAMQQTPDTRVFSAYCDDIFAAAEEMLDRLDEALDLASLQHGSSPLDFHPLDLSEQIAPCLSAVAPLIRRKGVEVRVAGQNVPLRVTADLWAVRRILLTILGNALHNATPLGKIRVDLRAEGAWARIEVRDYGAEMRPELLDRMVAPFDQSGVDPLRTTSRAGLGLAISRLLIDAHGGRLTVKSEPGQGTVVHVLLPLWREARD